MKQRSQLYDFKVFFCINIKCHFSGSFISVVFRIGFGLAHFLICGGSSLEVFYLVKTALKKFCQVLFFFTLILFKEDVFHISFLLRQSVTRQE